MYGSKGGKDSVIVITDSSSNSEAEEEEEVLWFLVRIRSDSFMGEFSAS
jgi:hypothetical protein